ncbi:carboxypeptidase-like regulatory domain-containing protein [Flavobacterium enshiense]|uniref:carboxypeptidase-like regulatory domain-containing protein n=1 Tax=Flavobacterium enshiense TaxID=1341165 RepID=UPI00345D5DCC
MKTKLSFILLLITASLSSFAQNVTARITDSQSNEPLPYANIKINGTTDLISNDEGYFNFSEKGMEESSILKISFIGYISQQLTFSELKKQNLTIKLAPASFELDNLTISNKKPDPYQIIAEVNNRLKDNYKKSGNTSKSKLFFRESETLKPSKLELDITKSTGYSKNQLKEVNADLKKFSDKLISRPAQEFKDMLCNYYYGKMLTKDNKAHFYPKLEVVKATNIKGDGSAATLDDMEEVGTKMLLKHLDTTKFYRIKSGLFGSRDTVTLNKKYNQKKNKTVVNKTTNSKNKIQFFLAEQQFNSKKLDFITDSKLYSYSLERTVYDDTDNENIYVIKFKPRKSKGIYNGTLYINESDYAVVKCHYELAEGKKVSGFNLKLLLGVKASENLSKGTIIFKKNTQNKNYDLHYAYEENGQYFYVNRPLKFIELTNEEKDVVALDIKVEGNSITKTEVLNISKSEISDDSFTSFKETDFDYIQLKRYDPSVWENHVSLEPLEAMKQYRVPNDY